MSAESRQDNIIVAQSGTPFKTEAAAHSAAKSKGYPKEAYDIGEYGDGYAIYLKEDAEMTEAEHHPIQPAPIAVPKTVQPAVRRGRHPEGYARIRIHEKTSPEEPESVLMEVNGERLHCKRNVPTILPKRFLKALDNAKRDVWRVKPGEDLKRVGTVAVATYTIIDADVSPYEYEKMLEEGTKKTKRFAERHPDATTAPIED